MNTSFDDYYKNIYTSRWTDLKSAFSRKTKKILIKNQNCSVEKFTEFLEEGFLDLASVNIPDFLGIFDTTILKDIEVNRFFWALDPEVRVPIDIGFVIDAASLFPVLSFSKYKDGEFIDICASPGGKSLSCLNLLLEFKNYQLNDISKDRFFRLKRNVDSMLSKENLEKVRFSKLNGEALSVLQKTKFQRILLDAPCSSESHIINNDKFLDEWSEKRGKNLARRQWALITNAFEILSPGGELVYSTCSINPKENDQIIKKLLKKREGKLEVVDLEDCLPVWIGKLGENTEFGKIFLPDACHMGPIFISKIRKI